MTTNTPYPAYSQARSRTGFTLIELLIVLAIIGIIGGITVMSGRPIARGQDARAAVKTVQQSIWQGATMAASRGVLTHLELNGRFLDVIRTDTNARVRRFELPTGAQLNTHNEPLLVFTPPGKVDLTSLEALPEAFTLTVDGSVYDLEVSLIGEVRATAR